MSVRYVAQKLFMPEFQKTYKMLNEHCYKYQVLVHVSLLEPGTCTSTVQVKVQYEYLALVLVTVYNVQVQSTIRKYQ